MDCAQVQAVAYITLDLSRQIYTTSTDSTWLEVQRAVETSHFAFSIPTLDKGVYYDTGKHPLGKSKGFMKAFLFVQAWKPNNVLFDTRI
jgi:hypothetical protein